jgi:hypothetical protein
MEKEIMAVYERLSDLQNQADAPFELDNATAEIHERPGLLVLKCKAELTHQDRQRLTAFMHIHLDGLRCRLLILDNTMDLTVYTDDDLKALGLMRA